MRVSGRLLTAVAGSVRGAQVGGGRTVERFFRFAPGAIGEEKAERDELLGGGVGWGGEGRGVGEGEKKRG